jgi:hypothetical protein
MKVSLSLTVWLIHFLDDGFNPSTVDRSEYSVMCSVVLYLVFGRDV